MTCTCGATLHLASYPIALQGGGSALPVDQHGTPHTSHLNGSKR